MLSTPGLQAYASAQYIDAGCTVGAASTPSVLNAATSDHAHAFAQTSYGINSAAVSGNIPPSGGTSDANAWSLWQDTLWITGGTGTGEVIFGAHVSGTFTDHSGGSFTLAVNQGAGGILAGVDTNGLAGGYGGTINMTNNLTPGGTASFSADLMLPYTFTYDVPFTLLGWLMVSGHLDSHCCGGIDVMLPFSADFSHTAMLDRVVLPAGASLNSHSGVSYPAQLMAVPEPQTYAMLLAGLGLLGFTVRRRKFK